MPKRSTKRNLLPQFKFQVALEALKELRSVHGTEIAASNKVHPSQVTAWKKELRRAAASCSSARGSRIREFEDQEAHTAELEHLEKSSLRRSSDSKKCKRLGIEP
ncbi:MAG: hypothetical protein R3F19_12305 [Verrucomicrobiales bacterium]